MATKHAHTDPVDGAYEHAHTSSKADGNGALATGGCRMGTWSVKGFGEGEALGACAPDLLAALEAAASALYKAGADYASPRLLNEARLARAVIAAATGGEA